jgi:hypothetical protein
MVSVCPLTWCVYVSPERHWDDGDGVHGDGGGCGNPVPRESTLIQCTLASCTHLHVQAGLEVCAHKAQPQSMSMHMCLYNIQEENQYHYSIPV